MLVSQRISKSTLSIPFNQLNQVYSLPASSADSQNQQCHIGTIVGMFGSIMQIPSAEDFYYATHLVKGKKCEG